jgi:hypothetical protein
MRFLKAEKRERFVAGKRAAGNRPGRRAAFTGIVDLPDYRFIR